MWDVPEIAVIWDALSAMGFITVRGTIAYPDADPVPWTGPDDAGEAREIAAGLLHMGVLEMFLGEDEEDELSPVISAFTHVAVLKAATPPGFTLTDPGPADADLQAMAEEELSLAILDQFEALLETGLMTRDGDTYHFPPPLIQFLPASVAAAMDAEEELGED